MKFQLFFPPDSFSYFHFEKSLEVKEKSICRPYRWKNKHANSFLYFRIDFLLVGKLIPTFVHWRETTYVARTQLLLISLQRANKLPRKFCVKFPSSVAIKFNPLINARASYSAHV